MQNDILDHLNRLRDFMTRIVERANDAGAMRADDWPEYTSHMALLKQLIDGAPKPHNDPTKCGCGLPATRSDRHGYPICETCNDLLEQAERKGLPQ